MVSSMPLLSPPTPGQVVGEGEMNVDSVEGKSGLRKNVSIRCILVAGHDHHQIVPLILLTCRRISMASMPIVALVSPDDTGKYASS